MYLQCYRSRKCVFICTKRACHSVRVVVDLFVFNYFTSRSRLCFILLWSCKCCLGRHCEKKIDWCHPNPCKNNAPCIPEGNSYNCECARTNHTGHLCHIRNWKCDSDGNRCLNGAKCVPRGAYSTCKCAPGYSGTRIVCVRHVHKDYFKGLLYLRRVRKGVNMPFDYLWSIRQIGLTFDLILISKVCWIIWWKNFTRKFSFDEVLSNSEAKEVLDNQMVSNMI